MFPCNSVKSYFHDFNCLTPDWLLEMHILYQITRQFTVNFFDRRYWKRILETNRKSQWKWTEIVKLKEYKQ